MSERCKVLETVSTGFIYTLEMWKRQELDAIWFGSVWLGLVELRHSRISGEVCEMCSFLKSVSTSLLNIVHELS